MLEFYSLETNKLTSIENHAHGCWINLANPTQEELDKIIDELGIPIDFFTDSLDPSERPHMRKEGDMKLIIFKASVKTSQESGSPFKTIPVGIILTPYTVITVCRHKNLARELMDYKRHGMQYKEGIHMVLTMLQQNSILFTQHLQELDTMTEELEKKMHTSMRNELLVRMMHIEKSLVYFTTSLKGNAAVLEKIQTQAANMNEEEQELLTDALIECRQAADMTEVYIQIISTISETSASMISNNMNMVMKFLTGITLVLMVPTIVVGAYGMNVPLPLQDSPIAFLIILGFTLVVCWGMWIYLYKKHWM